MLIICVDNQILTTGVLIIKCTSIHSSTDEYLVSYSVVVHDITHSINNVEPVYWCALNTGCSVHIPVATQVGQSLNVNEQMISYGTVD